MRQESVQYFTDKEEEFANLLTMIGMKKNVAQVLVFLAATQEASSREIERGTDLRQPEISLAMKYLLNQGWVKRRDNTSKNKGRPTKVYELAKTITVIMDSIEKERKAETKDKLALV